MISKEVLSEDEVRRDYVDENETVSIPTKKFKKQMENYEDDYYEQEEEYYEPAPLKDRNVYHKQPHPHQQQKE